MSGIDFCVCFSFQCGLNEKLTLIYSLELKIQFINQSAGVNWEGCRFNDFMCRINSYHMEEYEIMAESSAHPSPSKKN